MAEAEVARPAQIRLDSPRHVQARISRSATRPQQRKIFVAYPFRFPKDDYRRPFKELAKAFNVKFEFADDEITNRQILDKITRMILSSRFTLFDITTWNPNVSLELGIAIGQRRDYYLLFNPDIEGPDVPADLGGIDRLQYTTYTELETALSELLIQEFGVPAEEQVSGEDQMQALREGVLRIVETKNGPKVGDVAEALNIPMPLAKAVVRQMVESEDLSTTGQTRGTRYWKEDS
jgi:hypothetical protein